MSALTSVRDSSSPRRRFNMLWLLVPLLLFLVFGYLSFVQGLSMQLEQNSTTVHAIGDGWSESSFSESGPLTIFSFTLDCTPGPNGGEDQYTLTSYFLTREIFGQFGFGSEHGPCKPNLEDPTVFSAFVEKLKGVFDKGASGLKPPATISDMFADTIANIIKAKIPFLGL